MQRLAPVLALRPMLALGLLASCASPRATDGEPTQADQEQLVARVHQFNDAIRVGDPASYGDLFVEDFLFTWSRNGQLYDRATILPNVVPTPDFQPLVDEFSVRTYGDAAVVNFRVRKTAEDAGARVTFSYARIDDVWKVMASHSTTIVLDEAE